MLCTSSSTRKKLQKEEMWSYFPIATKKEIKVNFLYGVVLIIQLGFYKSI